MTPRQNGAPPYLVQAERSTLQSRPGYTPIAQAHSNPHEYAILQNFASFVRSPEKSNAYKYGLPLVCFRHLEYVAIPSAFWRSTNHLASKKAPSHDRKCIDGGPSDLNLASSHQASQQCDHHAIIHNRREVHDGRGTAMNGTRSCWRRAVSRTERTQQQLPSASAFCIIAPHRSIFFTSHGMILVLRRWLALCCAAVV